MKFSFLATFLLISISTRAYTDCKNLQGVYKEILTEPNSRPPIVLYLNKDDEGLMRWFHTAKSNLGEEYLGLTRLLTRFNNHFKCVDGVWEITTYSGGLDNRNRLQFDGETLIFSNEDKLPNKNNWSKPWIWKFQPTAIHELNLQQENTPILLQHTRFGWAWGSWNGVASPVNSCEAFDSYYQQHSKVITGLEIDDVGFFETLDKDKSYMCMSLKYTSIYPLVLSTDSTIVAKKPDGCVAIRCDGNLKNLLDFPLRYQSHCKSYPFASQETTPLCY